MSLVRLDPSSVPDIDDHDRPSRRESLLTRLWRRTPLPTTQQAILLWESGAYQVVESLDLVDSDNLPDDIVAGGYEWVGDSTSWQAINLSSNGFTLISL